MAVKHDDALALILRELSGRAETAGLRDRRRVISVLSDRVPEAQREIRVLTVAINDGAVDVLANAGPANIRLEIDRLVARIDDKFGIRRELVLPLLNAIAYGLDRGPLPSEADAMSAEEGHATRVMLPERWADAPAAATVRPPSAAARPGHPVPREQPATSWIGLSEPSPRHQWQAAPADVRHQAPGEHATKPRGIGGWLIIALIWLPASIAVYGEICAHVAMYLLEVPEARADLENWAMLMTNAASAAFALIILFAFLRRSRHTPLLYVIWLYLPPGMYEFVTNLPDIAFLSIYGTDWYHPLFLIVFAVVGTVYFVRSRRVKNTFVR